MLAWLRRSLDARVAERNFRAIFEPRFRYFFDQHLKEIAPDGLPVAGPITRRLNVKARPIAGTIEWLGVVGAGDNRLTMSANETPYGNWMGAETDVPVEAKRAAEAFVALTRIYGQAAP